jgi:hypothetical protein
MAASTQGRNAWRDWRAERGRAPWERHERRGKLTTATKDSLAGYFSWNSREDESLKGICSRARTSMPLGRVLGPLGIMRSEYGGEPPEAVSLRFWHCPGVVAKDQVKALASEGKRKARVKRGADTAMVGGGRRVGWQRGSARQAISHGGGARRGVVLGDLSVSRQPFDGFVRQRDVEKNNIREREERRRKMST